MEKIENSVLNPNETSYNSIECLFDQLVGITDGYNNATQLGKV